MAATPNPRSGDHSGESIPTEDDIRQFMDDRQTAVEAVISYLIKTLMPALQKRFGRSIIAHRLDDVLQEGLLRIYRKREQYDPSRGRFDVWAYRIVVNLANTEIKRVKHAIGSVDFDINLLPEDRAAARSAYPGVTVDDQPWGVSPDHGETGERLERVGSVAAGGWRPRIWLEQAGETLLVNENYQVGIDFVRMEPERTSTPEEGSWVDLTVDAWGSHIDTEPACRLVRLLESGDSEPVYFNVRPLSPGSPHLNISVCTRREKRLIQELEVALPPVEQRVGEGASAPDPGTTTPGIVEPRLSTLRHILMDLPEEERKLLCFYSMYKGEDWQRAYEQLTGLTHPAVRIQFARAIKLVREAIADTPQPGAGLGSPNR
jgi:DNA-directed RNA polymerase specialized sigma24 family protein